MKKLLFIILGLSILFISCNDKKNTENTMSEKNLIIGKWKLTEMTIKLSSGQPDEQYDLTNEEGCYSHSYYEFTKDGKYIENLYFTKNNEANEGIVEGEQERPKEDSNSGLQDQGIDGKSQCELQQFISTYSINSNILTIPHLQFPNLKIEKLDRNTLIVVTQRDDKDGDGKLEEKIFTYKRIK